jgi:hypothetical protein
VGLYVWWSAAIEASRLQIGGARRLSRREAEQLPIEITGTVDVDPDHPKQVSGAADLPCG